MKKYILSYLAIMALTFTAAAQAPQAISYQTVVRNSSGAILANQSVGLRFKILQGPLPGTAVYTETFTQTTTAQGLVNLELGKGTTTDDFSTIDWSTGPYHLETAIDAAGGTSYIVVGTSQLISVPYALHAQTAENVPNDKDTDPENEIQDLELSNGSLKITNNANATAVTLNQLQADEKKVDSMVANNGYAMNLDGISETVYKGTWSSGIGGGDSFIIATIPAYTTWHFDVVYTSHDGNSNTNFRQIHREFIAYRSWTLDPVVQNLVTHYDATTGVQIAVTFGTTSNQEVYCKVLQTGGFGTNIYYKAHVKITAAN